MDGRSIGTAHAGLLKYWLRLEKFSWLIEYRIIVVPQRQKQKCKPRR